MGIALAGALAQRAVLRYGRQVIGRRIAVYGPSGSGKTTLSRQLGELLDLPVIELDAIHHLPNWQERPEDEFRALVAERINEYKDGWVCDGNWGAKVRSMLMPQAETIIWLRLPFRVVYWRLLTRTIVRSLRREELWNGNRESFRMAFFSRDSILLWGITHWRAHHRNFERDLAQYDHTDDLRVLRSPREVESFLATVRTQPINSP